jgi:hypothetical protein
MNNRFGRFRVFVAALGALILVSLLGAGTGCSGGAGSTSDSEQTGEISLALMTVPSDVQCIVLTAQGSMRTATRSFDVMPGMSSIIQNVTGMPLGAVTFSASAYNTLCMNVGPMTHAGWVSDPVVASVLIGIVNQVTLEMHRNGEVAVGVDFPTEPTCTANGAACVQSAECCSTICSAGVCSSSAMCFPDGAMCGTSADCCSGTCTNGVCSAMAMCALDGQMCKTSADCCSGFCTSGVCSAQTMCIPNGQGCMGNADCCSGACTNGVCSTQSMCAPNGAMCGTGASCCSGFCTNGVCSGMANTCMDGMKDGSETDTDCGGPTCAPCAVGKTCVVGTDCTGKTCTNGVCTLAPGACMTAMDCTSPPAGSCQSMGTTGVATVFQSPGVCMGGTCTYQSIAVSCAPHGCAGNVCATM